MNKVCELQLVLCQSLKDGIIVCQNEGNDLSF